MIGKKVRVKINQTYFIHGRVIRESMAGTCWTVKPFAGMEFIASKDICAVFVT